MRDKKALVHGEFARLNFPDKREQYLAEAKNEKEMVDHPDHYNQGKIEVIDAIEDWDLNFNEGNVVKYVARHRHKINPLEDLKKAKWYLDRIINKYENN